MTNVPNTMLQAVMRKPGEIGFDEVPVPEPGERDVLVKIMKIGICGSDIHVYHGKHPYTSYPVVQGHEVSGIVVKMGREAEKAGICKAGDKVTFQPQVFCGRCWPCLNGQYHICDELKVMGFQTTGAASEYFAVDFSKVWKLPESFSFEDGAMVEPLAVAAHAVRRAGELDGKNVLVLGAGPIGNLTAQAAKAAGAEKVMITDVSDFRLQLARECGADFAVNVAREDLGKALTEHFGPFKADCIIECVGSEATMDQAIRLARKGSVIVVAGVFGSKAAVDFGLVQDRELRVVGTLMYQGEDYRSAIEWIERGKVNVKPLVTNRFEFRDYIEAYRYIDQARDRAMKVMINVSGEERA